MGAWGTGIFESDSALDFVIDVTETDNLAIIESALQDVITPEDDYLDADIAEWGLVAGEVIAALHGKSGDLPDDLAQWVKARGTAPDHLRSLAHKAVTLILKDSELRELWEESDEFAEWQAGVQGLIERLKG